MTRSHAAACVQNQTFLGTHHPVTKSQSRVVAAGMLAKIVSCTVEAKFTNLLRKIACFKKLAFYSISQIASVREQDSQLARFIILASSWQNYFNPPLQRR